MTYDIVIGRNISDKDKFGDKGLVYIGKGYVKMGNYTSLSNKIWMDVATTHAVLVAGKRGCLDESTKILTDRGYKRIKDFNEKEDRVFSFNIETKELELENAKLLKYPISNETLIKIIFENNKELILTKEHPLLSAAQESNGLLLLSWLKACDFKEDNAILSLDELTKNLIPLKIKKIENIFNINEVYDLSVDKNHSFIANGIISHNSGKSYSLAAIAEGLADLPSEAARNIASLIFDTMGIFWTMKYKNEKDRELLEEWGLEAKNLPVKVFVPYGKAEEYTKKNIPFDKTFALKISELEAEDWITIFNLEMTSLPGVLIERTINELRGKSENYSLDEVQKEIEKDAKASKETKEIAYSLFKAAETWGIFSESGEGTEVSDLITAGTTTVLDTSVYSSIGAFNVRALVISLVCRKLFKTRMDARKKEETDAIAHGQDYLSYSSARESPLIWIFIDEAHEFLAKDEKTPATEALKQILREGRQPGISLVLATQQPGKIHSDVMTQSDIIISHRVTAKPDVEALGEIMQTYLLESIKQQMNELPSLKGSAIILDDNSERLYSMRIRPRFTWHGGEAPTAIKGEAGV